MDRVLVMMRAPSPALRMMQRVVEEAALPYAIVVDPVEVRDAADVERTMAQFATKAGGGMIVLPGPILALREHVIAQAARHRLPAIYPYRFYAEGGGLLSYGIDGTDTYRRGASYADRILRGEKPADLPIQSPIKYELVINLKTAKALGIELPLSLLTRVDETIE